MRYCQSEFFNILIKRLLARCSLSLCLLLAACQGLQITLPVDPTPTSAITPGVISAEEATPVPPKDGVCSYVWESHAEKEATAALGKAFQDAKMSEVEAAVSTYGENCVDIRSNALIRYTPQRTNYTFAIQVTSTDDQRTMGEWVVKILSLLSATPSSIVAGTTAGQIDLFFQDSQRSASLSFTVQAAEALVDQGLRGAPLFQALQQQQ